MSHHIEPYVGIYESLGDLGPAVLEEFKKGWQLTQSLAEINQQRIAQANSRIEAATVEGIGQHIGSIDADAYFANELANPGCWGDAKFLKEFLKKNPECRVKTQQKATILVP